MEKIRDLIWNYPKFVIKLANSNKALLTALSGLAISALIIFLLVLNINKKQEKLLVGDTLSIGFIGELGEVNPLEVNSTDSEKTVTKLVFNGLLTFSNTGETTPDLAEAFVISPEGTEYKFFLRKGVFWHDGKEFTSEDVKFTYDLLKAAGSESGIGALLGNIECEAVSRYVVTLKLPQINAAFLEVMTLPIIPQHQYNNFTYGRYVSQIDTKTLIGTGPYAISKVNDTEILLEANGRYFVGKPNIKYVKISSYSNFESAESSFLKGELSILAPLSQKDINKYSQLTKISERVVINKYVQAHNTRLLVYNFDSKVKKFEAVAIRKAIALAINKDLLINGIEGTTKAYGPYYQYSNIFEDSVTQLLPYNISEAHSLLEKEGWLYPYSGAPYRGKNNVELEFKLTFLDNETNRFLAQSIRKDLNEIGVNVTLNGISAEVLQQQVLPQHEFEALLFEVHTGQDPDQYGLWHSSQKDFPGLNLGGYSNNEIDTLLEKGRLQMDADKRTAIYKEFQTKLVTDVPAVFLYHPSYNELSMDIFGQNNKKLYLIEPQDRFKGIRTWKLEPGWRNGRRASFRY